MIQIYDPTNAEYTKNGDMTLLPTDAEIEVEINSTWVASLTHPIDAEGRWKYITEEAVIKIPSFNGEQLFRVKSVQKTEQTIKAVAVPIFMDAKDDCFLVDIRPTNKTGQEALDLMTAPNNKYSGQSDISTHATTYFELKNLIEAINGSEDNTFLKRWGGEILFDNFKIIINKKIGSDKGVEIRYGKNIAENGIQEDIETRDIVTRIFPKAYNGYMMTNKGHVDSPLINSYPTIKTKVITFDTVKMKSDEQEGDAEEGITICTTQAELDAALIAKCNEQFSAGIDKPKVTIKADMVMLQNVEGYKEFALLEAVSLGDTVHCRHNKLDIVSDARVIQLKYNAITKKIEEVTLGDFKYNYFNDVSSAVNKIEAAIRPDGSVIAEKIKGFIDGAFSQLRVQKTIADRQDARAILFEDLDPDSALYGALAIGTRGIQISHQRNAANDDWVWTTAMTAEGMIADIIIAGIISDRLGKNIWNLDTGKFLMKEGTIEGGEIIGSIVTGAKIRSTGEIDVEGQQGDGDLVINGGEILSTIDTAVGKYISKIYPHWVSLDMYKNEKVLRHTSIRPGMIGFLLNKTPDEIGYSSNRSIMLDVWTASMSVQADNVKSTITPQKIVMTKDANNYIELAYDKCKIVRNGSTIWSI